tara:strand:- start:253 stop:513 length:261 start_codon:yes stop_codon:yes gene_type:complete
MSPLAYFLIFVVSLTALLIAYLTKQFQEENIIYQNNNQIKDINSNIKLVEKEKVFAEKLNGRFAMIGLIAAIGAYLTTGQIIPGFV